MKVKKLIELLKKEDPDRIVVMAKDVEGNAYSPLRDFWTGAYRPESTWFGEAGLEELTKADEKAGYGEGDAIKDGKPAIILTPIN